MRELTVGANDAGQRLDRFLAKAVPGLPASLAQKYIRTKRIKRNGARASRADRLEAGDRVQCYIGDAFFTPAGGAEAWRRIARPELEVVYEDDQILLLNKRPGMLVHPGEDGNALTLVDHLLAYLYRAGAWDPAAENAFTPALCNRLDRNTGGLVLAAKTAEALRVLNEKIRTREIAKFYRCVCVGRPDPPSGRLECFLRKDEAGGQMRVYRHPVPGGRSAVTRYETLRTRGELSLVEAELLTGRTHQIRAGFAAIGCPLLGDGKYGRGDVNRRYGESRQALCAYRLRFDFPTPAGVLEPLRGREFALPSIAFEARYFGGGKEDWETRRRE